MALSKQDLVSGLQEGMRVTSYVNGAVMTVGQMVEYIDKNLHEYNRATSKVTNSDLDLKELVAWCDWHLNSTIPNLIRDQAARNRFYSLIRDKRTGAVYAWRAGQRPIFYWVRSGDEVHFLASCGLAGAWDQVVDAEGNLVEFLHNELKRFATDTSQMEIIQPPPPPKTHTVVKGDTLGAIAKTYNVSIADLVSWNKLKSPDSIEIGQVLQVSPG